MTKKLDYETKSRKITVAAYPSDHKFLTGQGVGMQAPFDLGVNLYISAAIGEPKKEVIPINGKIFVVELREVDQTKL